MDKLTKRKWTKIRSETINRFLWNLISENCSSLGVNKIRIVDTLSKFCNEEAERKEEYLFEAFRYKRELEEAKTKYKILEERYNKLKNKK